MKNNRKYVVAATVFSSLLCAHSAISIFWHRAEPTAASQWGQNTIRSEKILYSDVSDSCVLVGSSMSARLDFSIHNTDTDSLKVVNLAYAGDSASTGLGLLLAAKKYPRCVIVETNISYRMADQEVVSEHTNPVTMFVKRWLASLRHENQPINQLLTFIKYLRDSKAEKGTVANNTVQSATSSPTTDRSDTLLDLIKARLQGLTNISDEDLEKGIRELIRLSLLLQEKGVVVILYEVPGEPEVRKSHYYTFLRNELQNQLDLIQNSTSAFSHQHIPDIGFVTTSDGIHLTGDSVGKVSQEVINIIGLEVTNH